MRNAFRAAAYTAYLLTPNESRKTFGEFLGELGMGDDADGSESYEAATKAEIAEAMAVCAEADELAAAGAYRKVSGVNAIRMAGALR